MAIPYDSEAVKEYTLINDKDTPKTVFHLGYLDASEAAYLDEQFSKVELKGRGEEMEPEIKIDLSGKQLETVRLKLKSVDNFGGIKFDFVEKHYPFGKRQVLSDKSLNKVKLYIAELATQILLQSSLSGEAEKN